jgi:hypothetical protein
MGGADDIVLCPDRFDRCGVILGRDQFPGRHKGEVRGAAHQGAEERQLKDGAGLWRVLELLNVHVRDGKQGGCDPDLVQAPLLGRVGQHRLRGGVPRVQDEIVIRTEARGLASQ